MFGERSKNVIVLDFKGETGETGEVVGAFVGLGGQCAVPFNFLIRNGVCSNWIREGN